MRARREFRGAFFILWRGLKTNRGCVILVRDTTENRLRSMCLCHKGEIMRAQFFRTTRLVLTLGLFALTACSMFGGTSKPATVIVSPPSGSQYKDGEEVAVQSTSTDATGIVRVELIVDNVIVRTDPAPTPQTTFSLIQTWKATPGNHTIIVRSYNSAGVTSDPAAISINVSQEIAQASSSSASSSVASSTSSISSAPPSSASTTSTSSATSSAAACVNAFAFIADVTIPDGTNVGANADFTKVWRISNTGSCAWGAGYNLVHTAGTAMTTNVTVPVPNTAPGATADLSVAMKAPGGAGAVTGNWRMRAPDGTLFGNSLTVKINVVGGASSSAPSSSSSASSPIGCSGTPNIPSFTASPANIAYGGSTTLSWGAVTNADSVEIDNGIGGVATPGNRVVSPSGSGPKTYTLTARCGANAATRQAVVTVGLPPPPVVPSVTQVLKQVSVPAGSVGSATAECPSGSIVTGGGFASQSTTATEVYSQFKSGNGWQVYLYNTTGSSQLVNAYAICLSGVSGSAATTQILNQVSVAANSNGSATATCTSGVLTGGGFASQSNLSTKVYTQSKQGNGWQVYLSNKLASSQLVNAYAICLTGAGTGSTQVLKQVSIPAGSTGSATATCPSGTLLTGGGYASQTDSGTKVYTQSKEGNGWEVYMNNTTGSPQLLNAYAICTSF